MSVVLLAGSPYRCLRVVQSMPLVKMITHGSGGKEIKGYRVYIRKSSAAYSPFALLIFFEQL